MPRFPVPEGETEDDAVPSSEVEQGPATAATRRASRTRSATRRPTTRWRSSARWASPATSSWSPTSSRWAKSNGIRVGPGRGSAAGSIVAYAMGITDLDPLEHGLLFERFLNPERVSMPDIDIDFDERRPRRRDPLRDREVRRGPGRADRHLRHDQGQGSDQGRLPGARLPVRAGRPDHQGDARRRAWARTSRWPASSTRATPRYNEATEIRALYEAEAEVKQVVDTARGIEGLIRQRGVHAAGVIMSREPLIDLHPDHAPEQDGADHHAVRLPDLRGPRPAEDGLPRACAT